MASSRRRQVGILAAAFAVVLVSDQATKWLAWRHLDTALINRGGFIALRRDMRAWFAAPTAGAVWNVIGALLVAAAVGLLLRRPRRSTVLMGAGVIAAGWTSNLLDRFGMHALTAPGSVRGVVDFIPIGGESRANVADVWILLGAAVLVVVACRSRRSRVPAGAFINSR